jgi:hypothetical protein
MMREILSAGAKSFLPSLLEVGNFTDTQSRLINFWSTTDFTDSTIQMELGISRETYEEEVWNIAQKLRNLFQICVIETAKKETEEKMR